MTESPSIILRLPDSVLPGQSFSVEIEVSDPDNDLDSFGLRWQGHGLQERWDVIGNYGYGRIDVVAPDSGPLYFRGEVHDKSGNGVEGEWKEVAVGASSSSGFGKAIPMILIAAALAFILR